MFLRLPDFEREERGERRETNRDFHHQILILRILNTHLQSKKRKNNCNKLCRLPLYPSKVFFSFAPSAKNEFSPHWPAKNKGFYSELSKIQVS